MDGRTESVSESISDWSRRNASTDGDRSLVLDRRRKGDILRIVDDPRDDEPLLSLRRPLFSSCVGVRLKDKPESDGMIELRDILAKFGPEKLLERNNCLGRGGRTSARMAAVRISWLASSSSSVSDLEWDGPRREVDVGSELLSAGDCACGHEGESRVPTDITDLSIESVAFESVGCFEMWDFEKIPEFLKIAALIKTTLASGCRCEAVQNLAKQVLTASAGVCSAKAYRYTHVFIGQIPEKAKNLLSV